MAAALAPLLVIAALIVAFGIIYGGKAMVDALMFVIGTTVGKVPILGWVVGKPALKVLQGLSHRLGGLADNLGGDIARSWHVLATIIDRTGWAIFHTNVALERLFWHITVGYPLNVLWQTAHDALRLAKRLPGISTTVTKATTIVIRESARPGSTALGKAISTAVAVALKPIRAELRWERARLGALAASLASVADVPADVPTIGLEGLRDQLGKIRARLRKLENRPAALLGLGALAVALGRLGIGWARCGNVGKMGRNVCRMDTDLLDALLAGTMIVAGSISLVELARECETVLPYVANGTAGFVRETRDTWAAIG